MKHKKIKLTAFTLAVTVLLAMVLTACGSESSTQTNAPVSSNTSNTALPASITDIYGRTVELPEEINNTVCLGAGALRMVCYAQGEDKVIGVEEAEHQQTLAKAYNYLNYDKFKDLPIVGQGGAGGNIPYEEEIIKVNPDVIIAAYTQQEADKLQAKTGIPVVCVSYNGIFDPTMDQSLELIGTLLGKQERCKEVIDYMQAAKQDLNNRTKDIPDDQKPTVFSGAVSFRGGHGIEGTYAQFPPFVAINAKNVVDETGKDGSLIIDKEKILTWNPDIIFLDPNNMHLVRDDYKDNADFYHSLKAVQDGKVYTQIAYNWYTTNVEVAIADAYYAGTIIYPEQFKDINIVEKANDIFVHMLGDKAEHYYQDLVDGQLGFGELKIEE
ncbi:MAG: iron ABC transporter substrate-binding protein [Acutalibacteraceae bacterium]|nr:iron ABC transporter substrate-binding protein [Acutalibacteraceae bacterium]